MTDLFQGIKDRIDFRLAACVEYETGVASKDTVLDVGGRNSASRSHRRLRQLSQNPNTKIVSTDVVADYNPDLVDDICNSAVASNSFDGIYCSAVLEHVQDCEAAIANIHRILRPGGELFVFAPFFYRFHDKMDYHRFTFAELDRILGDFSTRRLFLPGGLGYGGVFWEVLSFYQIKRCPILFTMLSKCANALLACPLTLAYLLDRYKQSRGGAVSLKEYKFYHTHLAINSGFCGWARK